MSNHQQYSLKIEWTGNKGSGTSSYTAYDRSHSVTMDDKPEILCSSDAAFRGDKARYTPEDLLLASISGCHMLWYLHLCAEAGVIVTSYTGNAKGTMVISEDGGGQFAEVTLFPDVIIKDATMLEKAKQLHKKANQLCFIARSCNFPIHHQPECRISNH